jgi:hypothetical protein
MADRIRFVLNDQPVELDGLSPMTTLLDWLREHDRTGTGWLGPKRFEQSVKAAFARPSEVVYGGESIDAELAAQAEAFEGAVLRLSAPEPAVDGIVKAASRHQVVDLVSEPADLEEIFLELYREDNGRD